MLVTEPSSGIAVRPEPGPDWDAYVRAYPDSSIYLLSGWALVAGEVFGHRVYFLEYRHQSGALGGVLPLVHQKTFLGNYLTSVAFFNYGGAIGDDPSITTSLMNHAQRLAQDLGCSYLELRDVAPRDGDWITRTDKVSMILGLPEDFDQLAKQLGSKLRSQVKRAEREEPRVRVGSAELLDDFYRVFAENMRDLGTPVFPVGFFRALLRRFPEVCRIILVYRAGVAVAAGFMVIHGNRAEIPWASCTQDGKARGLNMKLYWEVLRVAIEHRCTVFDFGRSTVNAGTYNFKKQWGANPLQLYWHRWERSPRPTDAGNPAADRGLMHYATRAWQRLPVRLANALGPLVSPGLPW